MPELPVIVKMFRLLAIYALCAVAGYLCSRIGLPLPWMIGPLWVTAALALMGRIKRPLPVHTRPFGQAVVASTVGLAFTPAALDSLLGKMPLLIFMTLITAGIALGVAVLQAKLAGTRLSRMILATFPIAPVESAILAEQNGIPPAPIIMAQTLRIAASVLLIPLLIYSVDGRPEAAALMRATAGWGDPGGYLVLALVAAAGGLTFRFLGWPNAFFLGPLALTVGLSAAGVHLVPYPAPVLAVAQIILGAWLGSTFQSNLFSGARRELIVSLGGTILMLTMIGGCAFAIAKLSGLPWEVVLLSTAPGGVTEMALTAQYLSWDVTFVTSAHLVRIFLLMPLARPLLRMIARRE